MASILSTTEIEQKQRRVCAQKRAGRKNGEIDEGKLERDDGKPRRFTAVKLK